MTIMWKVIGIPIKTHRVIKIKFASKKNFDVLCVDKRKRNVIEMHHNRRGNALQDWHFLINS